MGYGLFLDLPTDGDHAHGAEVGQDEGVGDHHHNGNIYRFSPFFNAGLKAGNLELVGWTLFNISTNHAHPEDVTTSLDYNVSALYHLFYSIYTVIRLFAVWLISAIHRTKLHVVFFILSMVKIFMLYKTGGYGAQMVFRMEWAYRLRRR